MFTGIVTERGRLTEAPRPSEKGGVRLVIGLSRTLFERLGSGDSLAVDGVCLTVVEGLGEGGGTPDRVVVELSPETLARTHLGELAEGGEVNLEAALRAGDPMGGHWVQGHVDGVVEVLERRDLGEHSEVAFELPSEHAPYLVPKGSVTLDGVSLTVSKLLEGRFEVALIPHTLEVTTLGDLQPGRRVHLEVDVLAKYVEQALAARGLLDSVGTLPGDLPGGEGGRR